MLTGPPEWHKPYPVHYSFYEIKQTCLCLCKQPEGKNQKHLHFIINQHTHACTQYLTSKLYLMGFDFVKLYLKDGYGDDSSSSRSSSSSNSSSGGSNSSSSSSRIE
mgnify:CR=1 FL=1